MAHGWRWTRVELDPGQRVRLRVGVVGAGRVGCALGVALTRAGHQVVALSAVSTASLRRAERMLPDVPVRPVDQVVQAADFVLLAVPDDAVQPLATGLATAGLWRAGQLVAHPSGAHGLAVLDAASAHGVVPLALHPVMTFTGRPEDVERIPGSAFGVTAPDELRPVAETLVVELGADPVWVPEAARPLYHAALTIGSNHLVTVVAESADLLARTGVEQPARLLGPLLAASLDNALRLGDQGLTGPVSRGDVDTVAAHLRVLRRDAPDTVGAYVALARRTAQRAAAARRLRPAQLTALLEVLDD